jgi:hypothetical protein
MNELVLDLTNLNLFTPPLPVGKIKLKNNNDIFIFIGINKENKYILVNKNAKQIYGNTFVCEYDNIEKNIN